MTRGVLLFASNNKSIDYVKQAAFLAKRIRKYMNLPTSVVTSTDIKLPIQNMLMYLIISYIQLQWKQTLLKKDTLTAIMLTR